MPTEKQNTKNEIRKGIAAIRRHMKPLKKQLTILVVLGLVSAVANGAVPYITGRFFDALINISLHKTASFGSLPLWAFLLALWALTQLIANNADWIADRLRRWADVKTHMSIQTEGFIHLFQLPLSYHKNSHISGEMNKISMAGRRVSEIIRTIVNIAPQFLAILIGITLAASINLQMAGVLLVGVILYVLLLIKILIPVAKIDSAAHRTWNDAWNNSYEYQIGLH